MTLLRRQFLRLGGLATTLPMVSRIARAQSQSYPARPVRLIVGFAPSGGNDIVARLIAQWLRSDLASPSWLTTGRVAAATLGPRPWSTRHLTVIRCCWSAPRTPSTRRCSSSSASILFRTLRGGRVMRVPSVILLNPSVQVKTVPEFIAYAKQNAGKLSMASGGTATSTHLAGELLKMMAGIDMIHVPYRGTGPAITDLLGGQVQVMFGSAPSSVQYIRTGQLRALAVTSPKRLEALPDVPTVGETVPGYEASQWYGIGVPKATPAPIVELLNKEINAFLADPKMKVKLVDLGGTELPGSPGDFTKLIVDETRSGARSSNSPTSSRIEAPIKSARPAIDAPTYRLFRSAGNPFRATDRDRSSACPCAFAASRFRRSSSIRSERPCQPRLGIPPATGQANSRTKAFPVSSRAAPAPPRLIWTSP